MIFFSLIEYDILGMCKLKVGKGKGYDYYSEVVTR